MDLLSNGDLTTQHRGGNRAWTWTPPIDDLSMTNKNLLKRQMGWAANLSLKTNHKNHKQYSWMFIWFDFQRYCNCLFGILLFSSYQKSEIGGNVTGIAWQIPPSMPETNWVGQFNLLHPSSHPTNQHNDHRVENYIEKWSCFFCFYRVCISKMGDTVIPQNCNLWWEINGKPCHILELEGFTCFFTPVFGA